MERALTLPRDRRCRERGVALAYVGFSLLVFMGFAVVAVDTARIAFTASESQAVADSAATAGIRTLASLYSGGSGNVKTDAVLIASQNRIDGAPAPIAAGDIQCGNWDFQNNTFAAGNCDTTSDAVRAVSTKQVNNLVAGVFGASFVQTTVTRRATSAFSSPSKALPVFPIAVGDCVFNQYASTNNCSDLPSLSQVPTPTQSSCWTNFFDPTNGMGTYTNLMPTACGGSGASATTVSIGDSINLDQGEKTHVLRVVESCANQNLQDWVIPIIACPTNCTGSSQVVAFAEIHIDSVDAKSGGKQIALHSFCKVDPSVSGGGGPDRGVKSIAMVE